MSFFSFFKKFNLFSKNQIKNFQIEVKNKIQVWKKKYSLPIYFTLFLIIATSLISYQNYQQPSQNQKLINYILENIQSLEQKAEETILVELNEKNFSERVKKQQEIISKVENLSSEIKNVRNKTPFAKNNSQVNLIGESFNQLLSEWENYLAGEMLLEFKYISNISALYQEYTPILEKNTSLKAKMENNPENMKNLENIEQKEIEILIQKTENIKNLRKEKLKYTPNISKQNQLFFLIDEENKKIEELGKILEKIKNNSQNTDESFKENFKKEIILQVFSLFDEKYQSTFNKFEIKKSDIYTKKYQQNKEFLTEQINQYIQANK